MKLLSKIKRLVLSAAGKAWRALVDPITRFLICYEDTGFVDSNGDKILVGDLVEVTLQLPEDFVASGALRCGDVIGRGVVASFGDAYVLWADDDSIFEIMGNPHHIYKIIKS